MSTKHTLGGLFTGFFGSKIMQNIGSQLLGEVVGKVGEEAVLRIQQGGKGFADEVLYALVSFNELADEELKKLETFSEKLWEDDHINNTENLKKLILFIATSAQEFKSEKNTSGTGKDQKTSEKKYRDTVTGGKFLKALVEKGTHGEMLSFCRANHVFDDPAEGYILLAKRVVSFIKEHGTTMESISQKTDKLGEKIEEATEQIIIPEDPGFIKGVFGSKIAGLLNRRSR